MKRYQGFSLVELMVVLTIAALLLALAVPSFKQTIQKGRITNSVNSFMADMRFTRSEAIRRSVNVVICRSNAPEATTPACDGNTSASKGWATGWVIYYLNDDGSKRVLRVQSPISSVDSVIEASSPSYKFSFNATGRLPGATTTINFGSTDFPAEIQRTVCVSVGGRVRVAGDGLASCS